MIVITILIILTSILFPSFKTTLEKSRRIKCGHNIKQIIGAIYFYAGDYASLYPMGGSPTGVTYTDDFQDFFSISPGAHNLGLLPYEDYVQDIDSFYCPSQSDGIHASASIEYVEDKSSENIRNIIDNNTMKIKVNYVYRGTRWYANNKIPAHGPALPKDGEYLYHSLKRPCEKSGSLCGGYHEKLSLVSDSFSFKNYGSSQFEAQGSFCHINGYNVGYTDGSNKFVNDPLLQIINIQDLTSGLDLNLMNLFSEEVWNAFDGEIGYSPFQWVTYLE